MRKEMSKSVLMKNAWKLATMKAKQLGDKPVEYISYGMKEAWKIYFKFTGKKRATESKVERNVNWENVKLHGRMTEKQERFIASLLAQGKYTDRPVAKAFNISSLRRRISKKQASDLIKELLSV